MEDNHAQGSQTQEEKRYSQYFVDLLSDQLKRSQEENKRSIDLVKWANKEIKKVREENERLKADHEHIYFAFCVSEKENENLKETLSIIEANYNQWKKSEIKDGAFSWHLSNCLVRLKLTIHKTDI